MTPKEKDLIQMSFDLKPQPKEYIIFRNLLEQAIFWREKGEFEIEQKTLKILSEEIIKLLE
jgi:hypothetical protein